MPVNTRKLAAKYKLDPDQIRHLSNAKTAEEAHSIVKEVYGGAAADEMKADLSKSFGGKGRKLKALVERESGSKASVEDKEAVIAHWRQATRDLAEAQKSGDEKRVASAKSWVTALEKQHARIVEREADPSRRKSADEASGHATRLSRAVEESAGSHKAAAEAHRVAEDAHREAGNEAKADEHRAKAESHEKTQKQHEAHFDPSRIAAAKKRVMSPKSVQRGARGGVYFITASGAKVYLKK